MSLRQKGLEGLWLRAFVFVLLGYALLDKGFAYLFLGEMLLMSGTVFFLMSRRVMLVFSDPVLFLWGLFAFWGVCRTVPFLSVYRFDAIRDAVVWAYGMFALIIVSFVNRSIQISRALNAYRRFLHWFPVVIPLVLIVSVSVGQHFPKIPWYRGVSILTLKAMDVAVQITAAGLFLVIFPGGMRRTRNAGITISSTMRYAGLWLAALIGIAMSRSAFLDIALGVIVVLVLRAREVAWKIAAIGIVATTLTVVLVATFPVNLHIRGRTLSGESTVATISSLAGGSEEGSGHEGTTQWRITWWGNIVHETFFGPYFWSGRGFGVNLAVADGPFGNALSDEDIALRSPHNGSMTILARMGVPGFVIWLALNIVFAIRMLKAQRSAVRAGSRFWSGLNLWIFACWLITFANLSFDVYLEGPQGGIWFWSIIGFGIAALRIQSYEARQLLSWSRIRAQDDVAFAARPANARA